MNFFDNVLALLNERRPPASSVAELQDFKSVEVNSVDTIYRKSLDVSETFEKDFTDDDAKGALLKKITSIFDEAENKDKDAMLSRFVTHVDVEFSADHGKRLATASLFLYAMFMELDAVSPAIDGDLVVQGNMLVPGYGPVLCTVHHSSLSAATKTDDYTFVTQVAPWQMMFTPGDPASENISSIGSFIIPISLGPEYKEGSIKVEIYTVPISSIPYEDDHPERETFVADPALYGCALSYTTKAILQLEYGNTTSHDLKEPENRAARAAFASRRSIMESGVTFSADDDFFVGGTDAIAMPNTLDIITAVAVALDYDDLSSLRADGYECNCIKLAADSSVVDEQEHMWKFHVLTKSAPYVEGSEGLEDIMWLQAPKVPEGEGEEPSAGPGYTLVRITPFSAEIDTVVYLAYKLGPSPQYAKLSMLCAEAGDGMDVAQQIESYVTSSSLDFVQAPMALYQDMPGPAGIILHKSGYNLSGGGKRDEEAGVSATSGTSADDEELGEENNEPATGGGSRSRALSGKVFMDFRASDDDENSVHSDISRVTDEDEGEHKNDTDRRGFGERGKRSEVGFDEESYLRSLREKIENLKAENAELTDENIDFQKKCIAFILKEKAQQTVNANGQGAAGGNPISKPIEVVLDAEQAAEKEKMFNDSLRLIADGREKLEKQEEEFGQLALELQTRLDDKEFKAGEIGGSFKEFKREILGKAISSRTGKPISQQLLDHYEQLEQKKEEDLERVRLKNISLRSYQRKLERTLRAKEQLAEGLHMIDFEQLKIENQTLNEKIEERNEELSKLKRKKTVTVQVLTHIREKLQFVQKTNQTLRARVAEFEEKNFKLRADVTASKKERDDVKEDNKELKLRQGFANSDILLRDFEARKSKIREAKDEVAALQEKFKMLSSSVQRAEDKLRGAAPPALNGGSGRKRVNNATVGFK